MSDLYRRWGVSAQKAFLASYQPTDAFCSALPWGHKYVFLHADGIGTKGILAYLWWKETGDTHIWRNLAQDALVMNTDDLACVGAMGPFIFSTTLLRNAHHVPDAIVQEIIAGVYDFTEKLNDLGIEAHVAGGETADMTDVVKTLSLEATAYTEMPPNQFFRFRPIDKRVLIVGLASYGQTTYETEYNSGIGSNGLTAARHLLLHPSYAPKYPETYDPNLPAYQGNYLLSDTLADIPIGKLLLSPTRTYLPFLREIFATERQNLYAVIHSTGGGQTKVRKYLKAHIVKEHWTLPPLFEKLLALTSVQEAFQIFNMGYRMELYVDPKAAERIQNQAQKWHIPTQILGYAQPGPPKVEIHYQEQKVIF
ncbi:MAG: AIR synthase related protein [Bacteroidia bacterium]